MAKRCSLPCLEEELTCPICLDIYRSPVSLSCGHTFCNECTQQARSHQSRFSCPLCCAQADTSTELQPNILLCNIIQRLLDAPAHQEEENHKTQCEEKRESSGQQDKVILCDFCLQEPQPAVKTCLNCEASLCQAHMSKHSTEGLLKDHVLSEPCDAWFLSKRCPRHGTVLESFCKTDSIWVCMLCCVTGSHKNHEVATLEEAFGEAQSAFQEILKAVRTQEAALDENIQNLLKQKEEVKTKETLRKNRLKSLFEEMRLQLDDKKGDIVEALSHNEKQQLSIIQMQIDKLKEGKDAVSHDVQELEALRDQKDPLLFTKAFAVIQARKPKPVPKEFNVKLPTPPIILDKLTTDTTLRLFRQFLSDMQSFLKAPPVHEHLTTSMHRQRGFAHCNTTIFAGPLNSLLFGVPNIYGVIPYVQSDQSFSEGCHFWEVDTSKARCWKLGVINPSFECYLEMSRDYCLHVFFGQRIAQKYSPAALQVVRVELDCERSTLSFYNVSVKGGDPAESLKLIETVSIPSHYPVRATFGVSAGSLKLL